MAEGTGSLAEVEISFRKFAVHGDTKATGKEMNGKNFVKLCKDCRVIDGKNKVAKAAAVDRLTDSSKYTGSHKERFDDTGKGKGKAGRQDIPDTSGYVGAYKGQGTYDDKVKPHQDQ
ncbi:hypothetical protein JZ751_014010 [Albula glossodonta]|uniref:Tubulin polymerization-promoting protein family member 3 n=1 Tax=Albula glossodonta TaxID=121402 RepID=A0A8T2MJ88_9TELE|nr:hypothetical protein JZ751_014010 [Albula glossodonta]